MRKPQGVAPGQSGALAVLKTFGHDRQNQWEESKAAEPN